MAISSRACFAVRCGNHINPSALFFPLPYNEGFTEVAGVTDTAPCTIVPPAVLQGDEAHEARTGIEEASAISCEQLTASMIAVLFLSEDLVIWM
jgi:hypothetical protein